MEGEGEGKGRGRGRGGGGEGEGKEGRRGMGRGITIRKGRFIGILERFFVSPLDSTGRRTFTC